jgi:microcystin-dependent protein
MSGGVLLFPPVTPSPASSVPTAAIMDFGGINVPTGWLLCDGTVYLNTLYPVLAVALGNTYGGVAGTSFAVPNLQAKFALGAGPGRVLGVSGGSADAIVPTHNHDLTSALGTNITGYVSADHAHGINQHYHSASTSIAAANTGSAGFLPQQPGGGSAAAFNGTFNAHGHGATTSIGGEGPTGAGVGTNTNGIGTNHYHSIAAVAAGIAVADQRLPPYVVVNKIIKV